MGGGRDAHLKEKVSVAYKFITLCLSSTVYIANVPHPFVVLVLCSA